MKKVIILAHTVILATTIAEELCKKNIELFINPAFAPEPMYIENPYKDAFQRIKKEDFNYFEKQGSKYHK